MFCFAILQADGWAGWALPFNRDDGKLMHITIYARDCLHFVKAFLNKSGLGVGRSEPRSLLALQGDEDETVALEARNKMLLKNSFFHAAFEPHRQEMHRAGLLFSADNDKTVRNEMLCILSTGAWLFAACGRRGRNDQLVNLGHIQRLLLRVAFCTHPDGQQEIRDPAVHIEGWGDMIQCLGATRRTIAIIIHNFIGNNTNNY